MHHVELLLDDAADARVRREWAALVEADLPSQARHRSASNRPHVTLTMTEAWPDDATRDGALTPLAALPVPAVLGSPLVFGRGPFVLARLVVLTPALLDLQASLVDRLGPLASDLLRPGRWTPHVTLARRMSAEQVAEALGIVGSGGEQDVVLTGARHWDSEARLDEALVGPPAASGPESSDP